MTLKYLTDEHILVKVSLFKTLHLWLPLSLSLYALFVLPLSSLSLICVQTLIMLLTVCLGHCVGLHRYLIHESFKSPSFMTPLFLFFSSLSGIGGPLTWIKVHALRDHWQNQPKAPRALTYENSLIHDFFINLHCRIYPKSDLHLKRLPKDLVNNSWVKFFEAAWVPLNLLFFLVVFYFVSLNAAIWLVALRATVAVIGHWLVGYIVHKWGYISYHVEGASEEGRNSLLLGWLTFGEAYHNNHHKFPESAAMGLKKIEFDVGYLCIQILSFLGLAKNIKLSKEHHSLKVKK